MNASSSNNPFNYNRRKFNTLKILPYRSTKLPITQRRIFLNNTLVRNAAVKERIQHLGIPPAYLKNGVVIAKSPDNKVQCMGMNDKHQVQYIYHPNFIKRQTVQKYKNVVKLGDVIPRIEATTQSAITNLVNKARVVVGHHRRSADAILTQDELLTLIVYMLIKYHFRIGNIKYSTANKSFGITTLKPEHIHLSEYPKFSIRFIGKKGVVNSIADTNPLMWTALSKLLAHHKKQCRRSSGSSSSSNGQPHRTAGVYAPYLFSTGDSLITPAMVKDYLRTKYKTYITPKMFRTWYANYHLLNYLRQHQQHFISNSAKDKRAQQQCLNDAVTYVSEKLNNSHAISRKAYVSNGVFNVILNNPRKFVRELPAQTELHQYLAKIMKEIA